MRHKRLSLAEEKAYSLPAKLSVPMMVCIFPVLFVVILLPVFVRLYTGHIDHQCKHDRVQPFSARGHPPRRLSSHCNCT